MASADEHRRDDGGQHLAASGRAAVAAAVIDQGRLLVVSQQAAPDLFALPGGPSGPGETAREALARRLREEVGAWPSALTLLGQFDGDAEAPDSAAARLTVFAAVLAGPPRASAGLAALAWTTGADEYAARLAPALRDQVIPYLRRTGRLPGR